jgi:hypothetical protein
MRFGTFLADDLTDLEVRSFRIIHGPSSRLIASAVRLAAAVRNVMYRVTFRAPRYEYFASGGRR